MTITPLDIRDRPDYTHDTYEEMEARWAVVRHVYGGTETLREDYEDVLWRSPAETDGAYEQRASQAEVFPALRQTIDGLTGVVFRVEPKLSDDVPQTIRDHAENIDGQGTHVVVFLKDAFREAMRDGHVGVLIDVAPAPKADGEAKPRRLSRLQESMRGVRPYWVKIAPDDILSWRTSVIDGVLTLTQLVIREVAEVEDGEFASTYETRYRLYRREENGVISWKMWTEEQVEAWTVPENRTPADEGTLTNQTTIPFFVVYGGPRIAPLVSRPPLLDLAYANISHTNLVSDRRNGLHAALHPILVFKGRPRPKKEIGKQGTADEPEELSIGPGFGVDLPADPNANAFYVEHQGKSLGEGRQEVMDVEKRMAAMGLAMLQHDTRAAETAEAKRIEKDEKQASLSSAARSLQDGVELGLAYHANYLRADTGGSVEINYEFEERPLDPAIITALSNLVVAGQLSLETMWNILKTRGLFPEDMEFEEELVRILKAGGGDGSGVPEKTEPGGSTAPDSTAEEDTTITETDE